jgi:hypothetical protein
MQKKALCQQSGKQYFMQSDIKGTSTAELAK